MLVESYGNRAAGSGIAVVLISIAIGVRMAIEDMGTAAEAARAIEAASPATVSGEQMERHIRALASYILSGRV